MESISIFIFRRDFRLIDNKSLLALAESAKKQATLILPIFIFSKVQSKLDNSYFNEKQFRFMLEGIQDLQLGLNVRCFYTGAQPETKILETIAEEFRIKHVAFNKDLTPFATKRDNLIKGWCAEKGIECISKEDYTLHSVHKVRNLSGNYYQVFTPFMKMAKGFGVDPVAGAPPIDIFTKIKVKFKNELSAAEVDALCAPHGESVSLHGTRREALKILEKIKSKYFKNYSSERDNCALEKTTKLAAYMKFGLVSCREIYAIVLEANGKDDTLMSQLYWREFYYHLTYHKPIVLAGQIGEVNLAMRQRMQTVNWKPAEGPHWVAWCEGKTGFPFVDAGMRQLLKTGEMHNRARMIVSMFLTKNLMIDFRAGEKFLAQNLIDYDPCQNNGGWQWSASTGVDTQPYRMFNCWIQQKKFDSNCEYVKKWIPELATIPVKDIKDWETKWILHKGVYFKPIVEHKTSTVRAKAMLMQKPDLPEHENTSNP
jgi:deoxyribodipyrimidine photo-lyase